MKDDVIKKIYCFVDESGQDTLGKRFLVAVVIVEDDKNEIEKELIEIEFKSGKHKTKWHKAKYSQRQAYISGIKNISAFQNSFYFSIYEDTVQFASLVSLTTAKAILDRAPDNYSASVIVDGLGRNLEKEFAVCLRKLKIKTNKVKGARDESSSLIRLADALAGLIRDASEKQQWAKGQVEQLRRKKYVQEI